MKELEKRGLCADLAHASALHSSLALALLPSSLEVPSATIEPPRRAQLAREKCPHGNSTEKNGQRASECPLAHSVRSPPRFTSLPRPRSSPPPCWSEAGTSKKARHIPPSPHPHTWIATGQGKRVSFLAFVHSRVAELTAWKETG